MRRALVVARFTLHEAVSRRLVHAALVLSALFLAIFATGFWLLYARIAGQVVVRPADTVATVVAGGFMTVLGMYAVHFLSAFMALFLSVGAISAEVDSGALHALLAHPLRRWELVVGRWLGLMVLVVAYVGLMGGALFGISWSISGYEPVSILGTLGLIGLGAMTLLSASLLGSTRLSTLANGVVAFSLFGLAWIAGLIEQIGNNVDNPAMVHVGIAISLLVPSDGLWKAASFFAQSPAFLALASGTRPGVDVPFMTMAQPSAAFVAWSAIHAVTLLGIAVASFDRRDL